MMNQDGRRPVTLEDILRLKRAERPSAEFWDRFDRELRAKQLAAILEKRPWWRTISIPRIFSGVRRYHLPLGATAVLAVTILSVREYRLPDSAELTTRTSDHQVMTNVGSGYVGNGVSIAERAMVIVTPNETSKEAALSGQVGAAASHFTLSSDATPSGGLAQIIPLLGAGAESVAPSSIGPKLGEDGFAALQVDNSALSRNLLTPSRGFESRVMPARSRPVEPLAQMKVPSGSRRSNLIASATLAATSVPLLTSDHSARGLSDERLYDTVSRVNARGAGVLVKF